MERRTVRIVQVAGFYGPRSGGLRTCVDALGAGYGAAGHTRVLVVPGAVDADELTVAGRRVVLRSPELPRSGGYRFLVNRKRLASVIAGLRPDRLEVSDKLTAPFLGGLARGLGVPSVLLSHERLDGILDVRLPRRFPRQAAADRWNRRVASVYDAVVTASDYAAAEFERVGRRTTRVPLGVDLETFRPDAAFRSPEDGRIFLACVTRLSKEKRPELAIDTVRGLRSRGFDVELTLVGAGPMEADLERQAAGLPVTFTGHLVHPVAVAGVLARADVALSCCPVETFGLAALEAMACGTPVVIAGGGGGPELAAPGAAAVAEPTARSFADAVLSLLGPGRAERRRAARAHAERYPWSATVSRMLDVHQALLQPAC